VSSDIVLKSDAVRGFSFDLEVLEEPTNEALVQRARKALRRGKRS